MDKRPPLLDVKRQRLFRVDILASLTCLDAGEDSLEFTRCYNDRIDIFAIQNLAVILIDGPLSFGFGFEPFCFRKIAIRQGYQFG